MASIGTVGFKGRSGVDNVIYIPLTRLLHGIYQRTCLLINARCLAVGIGLILIIIEYLNFIHPLQENPAVASRLTLASYGCRDLPLQV